MDKSWMGKHRKSEEFNVGLHMFLSFATKNAEKPNMIWCPCTMCVNSCLLPIIEVGDHLRAYGMDQRYITWVRHGERYTGSTSRLADSNGDAYGFEHRVEQCAPTDAPEMVELVEAVQDDIPDDVEKFKKKIEDAETPLYPGCLKFTKLSTVVRLYNLKAKNGWSDNSFTEVLTMLKDMLPDGNHLPVSMYGAKKILSLFGMEYQKIHACPNDYILYRKEYANDTTCSTCNASRWKVNERTKKVIEGVPAKVLWYFPPIPRFRRMFQSAERAEQLIWHAQRRVYDGYLRHPSDSPIWKLMDYKWQEFGNEPRNLRLALSADGINPHRNMSSRYSCWPVLVIIYNLSPGLCMKRKYMMLTMLISYPHQPGNDIDVYFRPLLEDMNMLWENGVQVYDAFHQETFTLRAVILWTINDFPAYGSLCGCRVHGYQAYPICQKNTSSFRLKFSKKICYMGHRKFLPSSHPFRNQKKAFNGEKEHGKAPTLLIGIEVFKEIEAIENKWGKKQKKGRQVGVKSKRISADSQYWKKKSEFFTYLPYWKHNDVRNCLDVMHIAKNVSESLIGTLLNIPGKSKDGLNARMDLVELGLRKELAPEVN